MTPRTTTPPPDAAAADLAKFEADLQAATDRRAQNTAKLAELREQLRTAKADLGEARATGADQARISELEDRIAALARAIEGHESADGYLAKAMDASTEAVRLQRLAIAQRDASAAGERYAVALSALFERVLAFAGEELPALIEAADTAGNAANRTFFEAARLEGRKLGAFDRPYEGPRWNGSHPELGDTLDQLQRFVRATIAQEQARERGIQG